VVETRRAVDFDTARRAFAGVAVVRVGTRGPEGPHVVPMWFVWETTGVYCSAFGGTVTLDNVRRDRRVALAFDTGHSWAELGGVVLRGTARLLRPEHPDLRGPMSRWYEKYRERFGPRGFGSFAETTAELWFLRIVPDELSWWDHGAGPFAATR
jgi:nitroimidazol reductase NimA-like FMN-containing flavoprotein (pyridoxamine 5'-phosphate oxidase superfamily)